jgi:basic membrane protein A
MRVPEWIVLGACLVLAAACKGKAPEAPEAPEAGGAPAPSPAAPAAEQPGGGALDVVPGKLNVAFVYVGPVGDGGWTYAHDQGRKQLEQAVPGVRTEYVESVAEGAEAEQVIRALARKGVSLLVTTSFGFMDATEAVAQEFPGVRFLHISGFKKNATNFGNAFGAMESMKYLSGMIAGARARADGVPRVGYIAPFPIPEVIRLVNGVALGMRQTCPECTLELRWVHSWFDPGREQEAAESLFDAGVDVVITGADTTGPIVTAERRGKWAVGYDSSNACDAAPARCLTTAYWSWGVLYREVARQIQAGTWKPSAWYGEASTGVVGLKGFEEGAQPAPGVPAEVVPLVKRKLEDMRAGRFTRFDIFAGPIRDNRGREVVAAGQRLSQQDLEGLSGCTICMGWLAEGVVGEIPR